MPYHNHCEFIGHAGKDAEVRPMPSSADEFVKFSLAISAGRGEAKRTTWLNIVVFGKAVQWAKSVRKGNLIHVAGSVESRSYTDRDGNKRESFEVIARTVNILTPRTTAEDSGQRREAPEQPQDDDGAPPF